LCARTAGSPAQPRRAVEARTGAQSGSSAGRRASGGAPPRGPRQPAYETGTTHVASPSSSARSRSHQPSRHPQNALTCWGHSPEA
jgi:hypothetical protein